MKAFSALSLRVALLSAIVAVSAGCPTDPAETTVKPIKKASPKASAGTGATASTAPTGDSPTATPDGSNTTPTPNGTPTSKATATPVGATPTPAATDTAAATGTPTPSVGPTDGGTIGGSTPTPTPTGAGTATPTPVPTGTPTATPTPVPVQGGANVTTLAGNGNTGFQDADGINARFSSPFALAIKPGVALYVGDDGDHRVRKVDLAGANATVTTIAGTGTSGYKDGLGNQAQFNNIHGMATDASGNIYVADGANSCIRKISMADPVNPVVSTIAGVAGSSGHVDGAGNQAKFQGVWGLAVANNVLYVVETSNHDIRSIELTSGNFNVATVAGNGSTGIGDGTGANASFTLLKGLTVDAQGNFLYAVDASGHNVRRVSLTDGNFTVKTIAGIGAAGNADGPGSSAAFNTPISAAVGGDNALYVTDSGNQTIRRIDLSDANFTVTTYAGGTSSGFQDAQGVNARFSTPGGISAAGTTLFVADQGNFRIRKIQ